MSVPLSSSAAFLPLFNWQNVCACCGFHLEQVVRSALLLVELIAYFVRADFSLARVGTADSGLGFALSSS